MQRILEKHILISMVVNNIRHIVMNKQHKHEVILEFNIQYYEAIYHNTFITRIYTFFSL